MAWRRDAVTHAAPFHERTFNNRICARRYGPLIKASMKNITTPSSNGTLIKVRDLVKVYNTAAGDFEALRDIQLDVERGDFLALYGKSGAGKSTLINMLTGIDVPTSGKVEVNGVPLHTMTADELSHWRGKNLGIVFQFFQLIPSLTLVENIALPMDFRSSYPLAEQESRALRLLETVGIAEHAWKKPAKISGGQQQRVAIARALANNPDVVVADEPTGNLDSATARGILDVFVKLTEEGKTVIVATHDEEIAHYATTIVEISDGSIVSVRKNGVMRTRQVA
jgi:ABC-type lipoprotein export system ATPase subunit